MFIYAFEKALRRQGKCVKTDISIFDYVKDDHGNQYYLPLYFRKINDEFATRKECGKYAYYNLNSIYHRLMRKIHQKSTYISQLGKYDDSGYVSELMNIDNVYIEGYVQSEKYFEGIREELISDYEFNVPENYPNEYRAKVLACNSVSIHVRRGDYINSNNTSLCNTQYYKNAISFMGKEIDTPVFFVFSDDIEWCKGYFGEGNNIIYVENQPESYLDMYLMSLCKHNIIADSTFSWWGAWLNKNSGKIVVAPEKWLYGNQKKTEVIPKTWIRIGLT